MMWGDVLTVWALGIPVLIGGVWLVVRLRRGQPHAVRNTVAEAGILGGTLPWLWMILTPTGRPREISLVPLTDLFETLTDDPFQAFVQVGANLIVFLPLGFLLPLRLPRFGGVRRMFLFGAALSALLETAQYVLDLGRVSSIDDVLMNAAGAAIGAWLARGPFAHWTAPSDSPHSEDGTARTERERRTGRDEEGVFVANSDQIQRAIPRPRYLPLPARHIPPGDLERLPRGLADPDREMPTVITVLGGLRSSRFRAHPIGTPAAPPRHAAATPATGPGSP